MSLWRFLMKFRLIVTILLMTVAPAALYARWIQDIEVYQVEATGPVEFSHYTHIDILGKNCPTCHNGIFNIVTEKNPVFTMADMEAGKSCGACHNDKKAFGVKDDCSACHPTKDITFEVAATGKTPFSHDVHTGMYGCSECHPGLFIPGAGNKRVSMAQMEDGESCGACHDGDTAFGVKNDCSSCHPTKEIAYKVPDAGDATFSHDVHTGMYGCSDCHPGLFTPSQGKNKATMAQMEDGESCGACHEGDTAFSVAESCDACHQM